MSASRERCVCGAVRMRYQRGWRCRHPDCHDKTWSCSQACHDRHQVEAHGMPTRDELAEALRDNRKLLCVSTDPACACRVCALLARIDGAKG